MPAVESTPERFQPLKAKLRGELFLPEDPGYDSARRLWNGAFDRRPVAVVRCHDTADVVASVTFAREQGLDLTVKGGGHGVAGSAVADGALLIDLSAMRGVDVDPGRRLVRVQGGATWGDVDHATQLHGLAVPGGFVSTTGVGGFTLGGGIAWTSRKLGLACDSLLGAEVVTAQGNVLRASARENADLFWGLRGGGGSFGAVTSFVFRGQRVGPMVYGGARMYPRERARELLRLAADLYERTPEAFNLLIALVTAPEAPFIPKEFQGQRVVVASCCYLGPPERGPTHAKELLAVPGAFVDMLGPMPYVALQSAFDPLQPPGFHNYWKSAYAAGLPDPAIDLLLTRWATVPSPLTEIHFQYFGGAVSRVAKLATAVGNRTAPFLFNLIGKWAPGDDRERNVRFIRDLWEALRPYSTGGVYANFLTDQSDGLTEASVGTKNLGRLRAVKRRYDPKNVFRGSHPVVPA